jgi:hypothetical protein
LVLFAGGCTDDDDGGEVVERLFSPQGNQLDVYDLESGDPTVLISADQNTVNGQTCALPDESGRFLLGEDTAQSEGERQGWGVFNADGTFDFKILEPEADGEPEQIEPFGCAFADDERLFTTDVGSGSFDSDDGKLVVFFAPDYEESCVIASDVRVAGAVALDDAGNVYVPETVPPGHVLMFSDLPESADECESRPGVRSVFIEDPEMTTPLGIAHAPNGNWYVSSVFLPPAVREYDSDGQFVRTIVEGDDIGNPAGISVASDGTLYYADLGLVQEEGELPGPGDSTGTVRKVEFDEDGNPQPPVILGQGLDYPDAVSVLEVEVAE